MLRDRNFGSIASRWLGSGLVLVCLSGCLSQHGAATGSAGGQTLAPQTNSSIIWARKDGQRMAGNPVLYEQGQSDKSQCEGRASQSGTLDFAVFSACMDEKGYYRRDLGAAN